MSTDAIATDPTFSVQPIGTETHIIATRGKDDLMLATIANTEFSKLGQDGQAHLLKTFERCVAAIRSGDGFPGGLTSVDVIAKDAVRKHKEVILETFGPRLNQLAIA